MEQSVCGSYHHQPSGREEICRLPKHGQRISHGFQHIDQDHNIKMPTVFTVLKRMRRHYRQSLSSSTSRGLF